MYIDWTTYAMVYQIKALFHIYELSFFDQILDLKGGGGVEVMVFLFSLIFNGVLFLLFLKQGGGGGLFDRILK